MKETESNFQKGFSLLELLIVIVIVGIISVMAMTQFGRTETRLQRQNIARELKVYLERARFDSIKRRAMVRDTDMARVVITSATAFSVTTDMNLNGVIDTADTRFMSLNGRTDARIMLDSQTFPITIFFDYRGQAIAVDRFNNVIPTIPRFTICDANCTVATATPNNSTVINITPTGTVAMLSGGTTLSNVNAPNVTTVSGNTNISNLVYVNGNY
ncbi:MAG TPA: prepilin-type N-terminal cleavage/methylation domain-containing protein [Pyrinomonadaceae bacterium]|jgi:prepilin-type N-terminal cleavage/methylation domain-containing protein